MVRLTDCKSSIQNILYDFDSRGHVFVSSLPATFSKCVFDFSRGCVSITNECVKGKGFSLKQLCESESQLSD